MASILQNLSSSKVHKKIEHADIAVAIVVSDWNAEITESLLQGAFETLREAGFKRDHIKIFRVPGTVELTFGAKLACKQSTIQGVIVLGCVIQGDTPHFDYVCQSVTHGVTQLNLLYDKPVIFGVLTTLNIQQAIDRAGGKHGNKGHEAAYTLVSMLQLQKSIAL